MDHKPAYKSVKLRHELRLQRYLNHRFYVRCRKMEEENAQCIANDSTCNVTMEAPFYIGARLTHYFRILSLVNDNKVQKPFATHSLKYTI